MRLSKKFSALCTAGLLAVALSVTPRPATAGLAIAITIAPPNLPVYVQPPCPTAGYLWTPGYWAWNSAGYFWVPGVWVAPPRVGLLWTPGYWGFGGGAYLWHAGFWGPSVGFYGGVNYGFGYSGVGFAGGVWSGRAFRYNTAVTNVNTTVIHNTYIDRTVVHNTYVNNRTSFNGPGGINARPTPDQQVAMRQQHFGATTNQIYHQHVASGNNAQLASFNHGNPGTAAMDSVNGRRFNQQGRIANGVSSGRLTAGETGHLENREARLNGEIHNDRAANGGRLTAPERQQVNAQQNNLSRSVYDDKHNGAQANHGNNAVGARRYEQQQRVAQGVRNGSLAPGEAARVEGNEQNLNRQVRAERQANGGTLAPSERQNANREQNRESRQIHAEKHNGHEAPR